MSSFQSDYRYTMTCGDSCCGRTYTIVSNDSNLYSDSCINCGNKAQASVKRRP